MSSAPAADPFGDFQTPIELAREVWRAVDLDGVTHVIEPTIGVGNFLAASPATTLTLPWYGFDINPRYVDLSLQVAKDRGAVAEFATRSAFDLETTDFPDIGADSVPLVIGNPPWVTSAGQASSDIRNLPQKLNRFGLKGLDALTGKANFDIAEAIVLALMAALNVPRETRFALLIKRSVALKMSRDLMAVSGIVDVTFSRIDAKGWFDASVEAGLLQFTRVRGAETTGQLRIGALGGSDFAVAGVVNERLVYDLPAYERVRHVETDVADNALPWRQGIKHDAAKLLELTVQDGRLHNGYGEVVDVEEETLCPFYKSSDLANGRDATRLFPLYQFNLSGPVGDLHERWPKLSSYLERHASTLAERKSRIYAGKPPYMLFGVGPYTSAPYKVAISGLYKSPNFRILEPSSAGAPPLVDDTCNLVACSSLDEVHELAQFLNSPDVAAFLSAVVDTAAKRPYTVDVLRRIRNPRTRAHVQQALPI